jgi:hypothetical protein
MRYVFQFIYLFMERDPGGSRFAYCFCYTTYALSFLSAALVYTYIKPIKLRTSRDPSPSGSVGIIAWALLLTGILLYLPILVEFRAYLAEPRTIYAMTRTGYGPLFFGSTLFATLGFVTYLFYKQKSLLGATSYYVLCAGLTFWHGSKGQILNYVLIWMLYRVYVARKKVSALAALSLVGLAGVITVGSFAAFGSFADIYDLSTNLVGYADASRNAMKVIDDPQARTYFGELTVENEFYSRIPRVLMPSKPTDYGAFALGKKYDPAQYRAGEGAPNYDIGLTYADFGSFAMIYLCLSSGVVAWMVSSFAAALRQGPTPGKFIVFIFLAGVNVIPISGVFYLPETMLIAGALSFALRLRVVRGLEFGHGRLRPSQIATSSQQELL